MQARGARAFRGTRVLVTGHTGFKGAWLCEWLISEGAQVSGLALPPASTSLFNDLALAGRMTSVIGDIREFETVRQAMIGFAPDIVFHLAAQALVRPSYANPLATFATNVMGTAHVLEAARIAAGVKAVVCVTSDKCYEPRGHGRRHDEDDPLGGRDPYSASKAAAEIVAGSYRTALYPIEGRVRLATARAGNVIGGGDWAQDRLVPDLARAMAAKGEVVLRNPAYVRPWQHVLEPLRGYLALGAALLAGEDVEGAWNFGPDPESEITVADLADRFISAWGERLAIRTEPSALAESAALRLDNTKAARLDWRPTLTIDEAVGLTADWYRARQRAPAEAAELTRAQIRVYASA